MNNSIAKWRLSAPDIQELSLLAIDHFTVSCLLAWPLNESEAGGEPALIETSLLFSC